jgi:macrodomain Ter protein organizer (MatP/YcbG family)
MKKNYKNEVWKKLEIPNVDENEQYEISNYGRLKSFKTIANSGHIMKNTKVRGYHALVVRLKSGNKTTRYIHKLVAEHFIPKESEYQNYVIHVDFDKNNNHVSNLKWVLRQTMYSHQKINPNYKRGRVTHCKLREIDVMRLKLKLNRNNTKPSLIAREFGITHTQLNRIKNGENWPNIKLIAG